MKKIRTTLLVFFFCCCFCFFVFNVHAKEYNRKGLYTLGIRLFSAVSMSHPTLVFLTTYVSHFNVSSCDREEEEIQLRKENTGVNFSEQSANFRFGRKSSEMRRICCSNRPFAIGDQLSVNTETVKLNVNPFLTHIRAQSACYELKGDLSPVMLNEIFHNSLKI